MMETELQLTRCRAAYLLPMRVSAGRFLGKLNGLLYFHFCKQTTTSKSHSYYFIWHELLI